MFSSNSWANLGEMRSRPHLISLRSAVTFLKGKVRFYFYYMHFVLIIMHLLQKYVFGSMIFIENMFKSDFYMNIFGAWNHPSKFPIFLFWKFALTYEYLWFASSIKERIILINQGITVTASIPFYNCCQSRREACTEPERWKVNKYFFNVHTSFFFF